MGFSSEDNHVRIDFFHVSPFKWYSTEELIWTGGWYGKGEKAVDIFAAFKKSLQDHFKGDRRLAEMIVVCLEPYHEFSHPIMMRVDTALGLVRMRDI